MPIKPSSKKQYKAVRRFVHHGRKLEVGESIALHPRQAKWLLGTHLVSADQHKASETPKSAPKKTTSGGKS